MELTTRCPHCHTAFAVTLEQLQLRKGFIRCIQCAHIFDAYEAVVPESRLPESRPLQQRHLSVAKPVSAVPPPVAPAGSRAPAPPSPDPFYIPPPEQTPLETRTPARPFSVGSAAPAADGEPAFRTPVIPVAADTGRPSGPYVPERAAGVQAPDAERFAIGNSEADAVDGAIDASSDDALYIEPRAGHRSRGRPELFDGVQRRRGWLTLVWGILCIIGLATLLLQGVYVYRAQLANNFPQLRPMLEQACERLGCYVAYDRQIDAIAITRSALRASAAPQDDVSNLTLEVTLRNTFDRPQEWPTLVLDLKDASGAVVVRRNLPPGTWVPPQLRDGPFPEGRELTVELPVAVRGLQANGYQLDKFFP